MSKFVIEFGPRSTERINQLATLNETSRADVVRRALEVYDALYSEQSDGTVLMLVAKSGETKELLLI